MKYLSLLLICFLSVNLSAQTDNETLNTQLNAMKTAFMDKDYSLIAKHTYPKIVEMMGGKEKMVEVTSTTMAKMESQNFIFKSITFKDPSELMEHNGDLQCALTQIIVMDTPNGKVQNERTLVAISEDDGNNWVFLDSSGMNSDSLKGIYPNLHPDLVLKPESKQILGN